MSYSTVYSDSLAAYQNGTYMANAIQKKIDNVAENEVLFGSVDYSSGYDTVLDGFTTSTTGTDGTTDTDNTTSADGTVFEDGGTRATEEQIAQLRAAYEQVQDEQGWVGKAWNGVKNFFGHKNGSNAVKETIDKAAAGEISYQAAVEKLNTYAQKQSSVTDTFANIASGLAVVAGVALAPVSFGASLAIGAGVGAAVKVGIKASDKATNEVEGDYTLKDGLKDGVTGAIGGVVTAATAGIGAGATVVKETGKVAVKETVKQGVIAGAKAGAIDGAVMGATNYTADAVFDGKEFTFGGLVSNTAGGAVTGAAVGGVVGGVTSGIKAHGASKATAADEVVDAMDDSAIAKTSGSKSYVEYTDEEMIELAKDIAQKGDTQARREVLKAIHVDNNPGSVRAEELNKIFNETWDELVTHPKTVTGETMHLTGEVAESTGKTFGQYAQDAMTGTVKRVKEMFEKVGSVKNLTPGDVKKYFTGKANATRAEFKNAYELMKESNDYRTNLAFRTFVEDAYKVGSTEQV